MAIIVEEQRNRVNIGRILIWAAVLVIAVVTVYYVFFAKPQLIEVTAPSGFKDINSLSQINLNPQDIITNPAFRALEQYVTPVTTSTFGRPNPFLSF